MTLLEMAIMVGCPFIIRSRKDGNVKCVIKSYVYDVGSNKKSDRFLVKKLEGFKETIIQMRPDVTVSYEKDVEFNNYYSEEETNKYRGQNEL